MEQVMPLEEFTKVHAIYGPLGSDEFNALPEETRKRYFHQRRLTPVPNGCTAEEVQAAMEPKPME